MILRPLNTIDAVYGPDGVPDDDLAEIYHEASKFYAGTLGRSSRGVRRLERNPDLLTATNQGAGKRYPHRPALTLPEPQLPSAPFAEVVAARRSRRDFVTGPLPLAALGALLHAAYGITGRLGDEDWPVFVRTVPSGGALYPLEVYALARHVEDAAAAIYHYDPRDHRLARLNDLDEDELVAASLYPEIVAEAAVVVVVTAMFWRSRVKYGLRGYRFALLEAGHLGQNVLLAATALGLAAIPLAGFFDARLERMLGLDGVDESLVHAVCVGPAP